MLITLHKNARTTPAIRAEIAASNESTRALAKRFGVSELTIAKWRKRASVNDLPHTPHRLQTTLSPAQEAIVVELRKSLLLPLDDLVAVTKEFICPKASRSGLDRSLRRTGHRTPLDYAQNSTNQRYGEAFQWPYQRCSTESSLRQW